MERWKFTREFKLEAVSHTIVHVSFAPKADKRADLSLSPLSATSGLMRCSKGRLLRDERRENRSAGVKSTFQSADWFPTPLMSGSGQSRRKRSGPVLGLCGTRLAADHYLMVAPRVTMPPWTFDALTTAHVSWETSTAFPASTIMPSDEIVIRAGPFIVKNRPMR
jgi:hypothetical protein